MSSTIPRGHWPTAPRRPEPALARRPEPALARGPESALARGPEPALARGPESALARGPEPTFPRDHNKPAFQPDPDPWFDLRMAAWRIVIGLVAVVGSMVLPQIL